MRETCCHCGTLITPTAAGVWEARGRFRYAAQIRCPAAPDERHAVAVIPDARTRPDPTRRKVLR